MKNQIRSELYADDKKLNYSSNSNDVFKSAKNFYQKLYTKETTSKTATAELFSTISNRNKVSNK